MKQKDDCDQADDHTLFHKLLAQYGNGSMNEIGPIVGGNEVDTLRQGRRDLYQLGFYPLDHPLFHKLLAQYGNGSMNEIGPIVGGNEVDTLRQGRRDLYQLGFDPLDHREGVLASAHDHAAADRLTLAVQFGNAPPLVRPKVDMGN